MMTTDRRDFLKAAALAGAGMTMGGCLSEKAPALAGDFAWGALLHLGSNMWSDWTPDGRYVRSLEEEKEWEKAGKIKFTKSHLYLPRDYMSVDWKYWREHLAYMKEQGLNMVFIDVGEAFAYPSHPELWVKGALTPDQMREELAKIRALGLEPVPKLNFSAGHDQWLREYHYMTSSQKYRETVADLIRDVCEVFDSPRYFHLGFDEEVFAAVGGRTMVVMRQGELWWKDFLFCVGEVERHGARAMLWSDKICAGRPDFFKHMPKSVLQVPWYYGKDFSSAKLKWDSSYEKSQKWDIQRNLAASIVELAQAGYDIMPCTSNWESPEAADAMLGFCKSHVDAARIKGYFTAPWTKPVAGDDARTREGIRTFAEAKRKYYA